LNAFLFFIGTFGFKYIAVSRTLSILWFFFLIILLFGWQHAPSIVNQFSNLAYGFHYGFRRAFSIEWHADSSILFDYRSARLATSNAFINHEFALAEGRLVRMRIHNSRILSCPSQSVIPSNFLAAFIADHYYDQ